MAQQTVLKVPIPLYKAKWDMHQAARTGDWNLAMEILVTQGDLYHEILTQAGDRALHVAVAAGHVEFVRGILHFVSVSELETLVDGRGYTALCYAVIHKDVRMAEVVVAKSPGLIFVENNHGETPLEMTIFHENVIVISYLLSHADVSNKPTSFWLKISFQMIDKGLFDSVFEMVKSDRFQFLASALPEDGEGLLQHLAAAGGGYDSVTGLRKSLAEAGKCLRDRLSDCVAAEEGGWLKGLRDCLSARLATLDEEKEQEMQIGNPTDVKHVAHIGFDGPAVQESPSWMKEFDSTATGFSAPLGLPGDSNDNPDVKWVSEDSKRGHKTKNPQGKEEPKSSRRQSSTENNSSEHSPRKKDPSKARQSRRKEGKDSSQESSGVGPEIPRKPRRKKSKELVNEGGSRRSRNRPTTSNGTDQTQTDPQNLDDEVRESRVTFKE